MSRGIEVEETDSGIIERVENRQGGGEIIHFLGDREVSSVENGRPDPGVDTCQRPCYVVETHRMLTWKSSHNFLCTLNMSPHIQQGEQDGSWFLDAT